MEDPHAVPVARGDRMELGSAEAWGRAEADPVGGWCGLREGCRCRFGMYVPPLLEHNPRNNRVRALSRPAPMSPGRPLRCPGITPSRTRRS